MICFRSTKYSLQEFLDVKNNLWRQVLFLREICLKVEKNEIWAELADQKHINNSPLARQFALMAVKLQLLAAKHVMSSTLNVLEHVFFVSCPRLDATDGNASSCHITLLTVINNS